MILRIASLYRYPVKGLSPERLDRADLTAGGYFPGDRLFAIENGPSGFDPAVPTHQPKIKFLMLMRDDALARLRTRYDDATGTLVIEDGGREAARGDLSTEAGRGAIETFFRQHMAESLRGAPKVLAAPEKDFRFTDSRRGFVSIINRASVAAIENMVGAPVDPLRFRGNVYVDGMAPWAEFDLIGQMLEADSGVRLKVTARIERCAATNVDPDTGFRDLDLPNTLQRRLGHADCGVYAEVLKGGAIHAGERLTVQGAAASV
jgi:uncharacterized protein